MISPAIPFYMPQKCFAEGLKAGFLKVTLCFFHYIYLSNMSQISVSNKFLNFSKRSEVFIIFYAEQMFLAYKLILDDLNEV